MPFPLDPELVKRTEAKLGRKLPPGYTARMCRDNGGAVEAGGDSWRLHPIFDDSDRKRLRRTCNDIVRETAAAREWPGFPPGALAIGDNDCGDLLVLLAAPDSNGYADPVYWWDHETAEVNRVAHTFEDLLEGRSS